MPTKDNNPGLLSKVAKFVRNPTTNWTDLDKQDPEPDAGYSKQALKEMIERKRQNDFVRRREFDQLRRLRSRDPNGGNPDLAGRPSYFQSSLPSNSDERAMTIKKIDEIEAQMSNQWWQVKHDGLRGDVAGDVPAAAATPGARPAAPLRSGNLGYTATKLSPMMPDSTNVYQADFVPTQTNSSFARSAAAMVLPAAAENHPAAGGGSWTKPGDGGGFTNPAPLAVAMMIDGVTDPDLEEAAIRFANGDHAGAETGLLNALQSGDVRRDLADIWTSSLFDLYRATGQQARFDSVAIEYAERFGRSAPAWFSMPDLLGIKIGAATERTVPSRLEEEPIWRSPANFTRASFDELQLAVANAASPWFLDWSEIERLAPDAVDPLGKLFSDWCTTPLQLRFAGSDNLERVLRAGTPSGDKTVGPAQWRLRMDALRVMRLQDEFELVALDFCVTYEVSPPSWQDARCGFFRESTHGPHAAIDSEPPGIEEIPRHEADDTDALTIPIGFEASPATLVELSGEVLGEATEALAKLEDARQGSDRMVISCANLIRVDFSAAGSILNWVATRQAEGCNLQFRDVHRLVAAFFNVIGINEHARVVVRST